METLMMRRWSQVAITVGTDRVVFGFPIPQDGVLRGFDAEMSITGAAHISALFAHVWATESWIVPITDPDNVVDYDVLWDRFVPKDDDTQLIDLDTTAADTTVFSEPGEMDFSMLFDVGLMPERLHGKSYLVTPADEAVVFDAVPAAVWFPTLKINVNIRKEYKVEYPSALMIAVGNPALDDTTSTPEATPTENEWYRLRYITDMAQDALHSLFGLTESGAETPYDEMVDLLQKYLEPDVLEDNAGRWASGTINVHGRATAKIEVPGELEHVNFDSRR